MAEAQDAANAAAAPAPAPENKEQDGKGEDWKFIPAQPLREDQVQNAVNFLSHPKVKGSPVVYRRSFLERKGLTREEIDEAFRRVPDLPETKIPQASTTVPVVAQSSPQLVAVPNQQLQTPAVVPKTGASWTRMVLAIGLLSAAGAGAAVATKNYLFPRMKAWLRRVVLEEEQFELKKKTIADVEAAKASASSTAVVDMVSLVREVMSSRLEERRHFDGVIKAIEAQTREMKLSLEAQIKSLETQTREFKQSLGTMMQQKPGGVSKATVSESNGFSSFDPHRGFLLDGQTTKVSHGAPQQLNNGRPSSAPSANEPPHSASYMEVMAMLERGEKPPGIREVNDKPPNASQAPSNSLLQPKAKPWERSEKDLASDWWRQSKDKRSADSYNSVKIVEIEDEQGGGVSGSSSAAARLRQNDGAAWVPPPAPKTILPGVDAAIRHKAPPPPSAETDDFHEAPEQDYSAETSGARSSKLDSPEVSEIAEEN